MVLALLLSLIAVSISGLELYAIEEGRGPLAQLDLGASDVKPGDMEQATEDRSPKGPNSAPNDQSENDVREQFWEELHEASANLTLLLIVVHIIGVLVACRLHHENLVKAVITGRKRR